MKQKQSPQWYVFPALVSAVVVLGMVNVQQGAQSADILFFDYFFGSYGASSIPCGGSTYDDPDGTMCDPGLTCEWMIGFSPNDPNGYECVPDGSMSGLSADDGGSSSDDFVSCDGNPDPNACGGAWCDVGDCSWVPNEEMCVCMLTEYTSSISSSASFPCSGPDQYSCGGTCPAGDICVWNDQSAVDLPSECTCVAESLFDSSSSSSDGFDPNGCSDTYGVCAGNCTNPVEVCDVFPDAAGLLRCSCAPPETGRCGFDTQQGQCGGTCENPGELCGLLSDGISCRCAPQVIGETCFGDENACGGTCPNPEVSCGWAPLYQTEDGEWLDGLCTCGSGTEGGSSSSEDLGSCVPELPNGYCGGQCADPEETCITVDLTSIGGTFECSCVSSSSSSSDDSQSSSSCGFFDWIWGIC